MTAEIFELGYAPESHETIGEWAYENVRLRDSLFEDNRFLLDETPWLAPILDTLFDPQNQETVMMCCAQGGKTVAMIIALVYALAERPGNTIFAAQTIDEAKDTAKEKIIPVIETCPPLAAQLPAGNRRHLRSYRQIQFPNATLRIGPANEAFLRGKTAPWCFGDECSMWAPGKMEQLRARQTRIFNRKIFFASTPLDARSDFEKAFLEGSQQRYHLATPCCGHLVYLTSQNLEKLFVWDPELAKAATSSDTVAEKEKDESDKAEASPWDLLKESVRLVCPKCGKRHAQTKEGYRNMIAAARYLRGNKKASKEKASFAFNVFCLSPDVFGWGKIVELWLKAKAEELKGNLAPLKELVTLRLAETWDERAFLSYTLPNFQEYNPTDEWPDEMFRALTVDCQEHLAEFHFVVRAWAKDGSSRLIDYGTIHTEAEIVALEKQWKIKKHLVGLDCAYERYRVFDMCHRNGWTAMCGDDRKEWLHAYDDRKGVLRPFSPFTAGDPRSGKTYFNRGYCLVVNWSNPVIKDLLWNLKSGKGRPWVARDLGPELSEKYAKGVDSERKREVIDRFGRMVLRWMKIRANHPWDCECMQVVFACIAECFSFGVEPAKESRPKEELAAAA